MSDHKTASNQALGSMIGIISTGQAIQSLVLAGALPVEIEALRQTAHDQLDAYLDHMASAATHARAILGG